MNFINSIIVSMQYKYNSNKEIMLYNHMNNAYFRQNVIFNNNVGSKATKGQLFNNKIVKIDYLKNQVIKKDSNMAYLFLYDNTPNKKVKKGTKTLDKSEIIEKYKDIIYDPQYLTLLLDRPIAKYIFEFKPRLQPGMVRPNLDYHTVTLEDYNQFMLPSAITIAILLLICTNIMCKQIIYRLAKLEPNFNDFIIKNTVTKKYEDIKDNIEDHCIICYEEYIEDSVVRKLSCDHSFHTECIDRWLLSRQHYCPCCRKTVIISSKY